MSIFKKAFCREINTLGFAQVSLLQELQGDLIHFDTGFEAVGKLLRVSTLILNPLTDCVSLTFLYTARSNGHSHCQSPKHDIGST